LEEDFFWQTHSITANSGIPRVCAHRRPPLRPSIVLLLSVLFSHISSEVITMSAGRLLRLASSLRPQIRNTSYDVSHFKLQTMDALPVPKGSWKAANDSAQMKNNVILGGSIVFFIVSVVVGVQTDTLNMFTGPEFKNKD